VYVIGQPLVFSDSRLTDLKSLIRFRIARRLCSQRIVPMRHVKTGTPVVTFIHPGDHAFAKEAPPVVVKFFKEHAKP